MGMEIKHFQITLLLSCCLAAAAAAGIGSSSVADAIADVARSLARPPSTWTAGGGDACSFKGVTCSPSGRVTAIDLAGQGLAGTLPSSLSSLTALESLQLQGNALSGAVPPLRAPSLTRLSLEGNAFTSLPEDFLRATPALRSLSMDGLPLPPWPFPDAIFSCPALHNFSASNASIAGRFPAAGVVANLTSIRTLRLSHNNLTGVIPMSLGRMASLTDISLSYSHLQGPVPAFSPAVAADVVAGNGFCLDAPGPCDAQVSALLQVAEGFGYPLNLSRSWTGNDACSGWLGVICDASEVTILGLTNYNLSGTISPAIANLTGLKKLDLAGNRLTGEIPDALAALPSLSLVDVRNNRLTGKLPKFRASVDVSAEVNSPSLGSHHGSGQGSLDDGSSQSSDSAADASSKLSA
ncbi:receptor-like kinase TMK3 [Panicum miliaceum]|uniref:Receptor-like kinase TMK3 n=1 Tax=Panicum miliaceum TaxID=4540 RepID=A0A3L6PE59_PANMI|nr:receptor-like kinase TMK3 [Panicum miliaceum]